MAELKNIKIGTSGYSFLDWIGPFYPQDIEKPKMLDYYADHFNIVEIDSSYYRIPHWKVFENIEKKTPEGFGFIVRTHKSLTHERTDILSHIDAFKDSIRPLVEAKKLQGLLMQFPHSFRSSQKNVTYLKRVSDLLRGHTIYVEFCHKGWMRDEIYQLCDDADLNICSVDCPPIELLPRPELHDTSKSIYIRFHGRNTKQWKDGGALRHDYLYTERQLENWITKVKESKNKTKTIYMFFNNYPRGQAIQNAKMMMKLLGLEHLSRENQHVS